MYPTIITNITVLQISLKSMTRSLKTAFHTVSNYAIFVLKPKLKLNSLFDRRQNLYYNIVIY